MTPLCHKATTRVLDPPTDWDPARDGPCAGLPIVDTTCGMMSFWAPTWRDRLWILLGRPIRLCVAGRGHPPVSIDAETLE